MSDDKKLSLKEIRETLYSCRNFEITHLWQRSIFLFAFLLLCFTGYGCWVKDFIEEFDLTAINFLLKNGIACAIAILGVVLSIVWIMMAKGSKAWYEVYEHAITKIEGSEDEKNTSELGIPDDYIMGHFCKLPKDTIDSNIFTTKAGYYSPSKLNIIIGIVIFIVWLILAVIHLILFAIPFIGISDLRTIICVFSLLFFSIIITTVLVTAMCNVWAKSGILEGENKI